MTSWQDELQENEHLKAFVDHTSLKAKTTQVNYFNKLKNICDFLNIPYREFDPNQLTQEIYDRFIYENADRYKKSTLNLFSKIFNILATIYDLDIKTKLLKETDKFTDYLEFSELQEIISKADKEAATVAAFIFCTGMRPVSVISITKQQLMLNVPHPYVKSVRLKGGKRQDVVIMYPNIVVPLLKWYMQFKSSNLKGYGKMEKVFVSQKEETTRYYIYNTVRKCSKVLGKKVNPRMLRKGLGVHTKELGLQDEVRRMMMGHSDVKTTIEAYSDYSIKDITRELDQKVYRGNQQPDQAMQSWQHGSYMQPGQPNSQQPKNQEFCPHCKGPVDHEMLLCPHCWKEIKRVCQNCKRYINVEWKKCAYCGASIKKKEEFEMALFIDEE